MNTEIDFHYKWGQRARKTGMSIEAAQDMLDDYILKGLTSEQWDEFFLGWWEVESSEVPA